MKHSGAQTDKMTWLAGRIGLFGALYSLLTWALVGCVVYEQLYHQAWMLGWQQHKCELRTEPWVQYNINCPPGTNHPQRPPLWFFLVKYLSPLCVGMVAGCLVVWSSKTLTIWRTCLGGRKGNQDYV